MKKLYKVQITETNYYNLEYYAESEEDAEEMAEDFYVNNFDLDQFDEYMDPENGGVGFEAKEVNKEVNDLIEVAESFKKIIAENQ